MDTGDRVMNTGDSVMDTGDRIMDTGDRAKHIEYQYRILDKRYIIYRIIETGYGI